VLGKVGVGGICKFDGVEGANPGEGRVNPPVCTCVAGGGGRDGTLAGTRPTDPGKIGGITEAGKVGAGTTAGVVMTAAAAATAGAAEDTAGAGVAAGLEKEKVGTHSLALAFNLEGLVSVAAGVAGLFSAGAAAGVTGAVAVVVVAAGSGADVTAGTGAGAGAGVAAGADLAGVTGVGSVATGFAAAGVAVVEATGFAAFTAATAGDCFCKGGRTTVGLVCGAVVAALGLAFAAAVFGLAFTEASPKLGAPRRQALFSGR
jgi:hypothetical protein